MTLLIHEGNNLEEYLLEYGTIPDPISTDNVEFKIFQTIITHQLEGGQTDKRQNCQYMYGSFWGDLNRSSPYVHRVKDSQ